MAQTHQHSGQARTGAFQAPASIQSNPAAVTTPAGATDTAKDQIRFVTQDIRTCTCSALVVAWNDSHMPLLIQSTAGVAAAIKGSAGVRVFRALRYLERRFGSELGDVLCTGAGDLSKNGVSTLMFASVLHVAQHAKEKPTRKCVASSIEEAHRLNLKSIAFPLLGAKHGGLGDDLSRTIIEDEARKTCARIGYTGEIVILTYPREERSLPGSLVAPIKGPLVGFAKLVAFDAKVLWEMAKRSPLVNFTPTHNTENTNKLDSASTAQRLAKSLSHYFPSATAERAAVPALREVVEAFRKVGDLKNLNAWMTADYFNFETQSRAPIHLVAAGKSDRVVAFLNEVKAEQDSTFKTYGKYAPLAYSLIDPVTLHQVAELHRKVPNQPVFQEWLTSPWPGYSYASPLASLMQGPVSSVVSALGRLVPSASQK